MTSDASAPDRGKRRRKILQRLLIAVGVASILSAIVCFIFLLAVTNAAEGLGEWLSYYGGCAGVNPPYDQAFIEQRTKLIFPASARQIDADLEPMQDCIAFVRFEMASDDLEAFLATTNIPRLTATSGRRLGGLMSNNAGWQFDEGATYLYGNAYRQSIAVDTTDPETYTVLL